MQLSIIILNYNVRYFLELCVMSVQNAIFEIDAEIIVVDNNSSDNSCNMIKSRFPNVKLIQNSENVGFPKGNNIAVQEAKGEYICILNPDTIVAEDTFVKVLNFIKKIPLSEINELGIIGCKLIDGTGNFLPESKRGIPTPFVAFTKIFGLYKFSNLFGAYYAQHLSKNQTGKVAILVGAFMVLKRKLYNDLDGFDENCFMYSDDIDLSYRALKIGKSNYYFHDSAIIHYKGESTVKDETYMKRFQDAMNFFYKKHFKSNTFGSIFFSVFMKIGIFFFSLIKKIQGKPKSKIKPEHYILISENEGLRQKIENQLNQKVLILKNLQSFTEIGYSEIIFDNNHIDFKSIIKNMEQIKSKKITFKILPKSAQFLIGSNSSFDRGEVILLSDLN